MAQPYVGEIRMFGGNFAPLGWAFCDGQLLSISDYEALYSLIGTTYGGDGVQTFALPDLRGRLPIHQSPGYALGSAAGTESITLTPGQMPMHTHLLLGSTAEAETASPSNALLAASADTPFYGPSISGKGAVLNPLALSAAGGSQPHDNMMPSICVTFMIALEGIYPSQG